MNSALESLERKFSRIYVESEAKQYRFCQMFLERFPKAKIIEIDDYKHVFNRPQQNWQLQKQTLAPILAVKKDEFLYPASDVAPDFGFEHFYYNALILNCLYDCEYCYLQGMFPSARSVFFVNIEDYLTSTERFLEGHNPLYICLSYDTDLLAYEHLLPYCEEWIRFTEMHPDLTVEIRTKSAHKSLFSRIEPNNRVILAWTFSPGELIERAEHGTARLSGRLNAAKEAQAHGWNVRICIDPIIRFDGWENAYRELIQTLRSELSEQGVTEISLGSFRMGRDYFKRSKKRRPLSPVLQSDFVSNEKGVTYSRDTERVLIETVHASCKEFFPSVPVQHTYYAPNESDSSNATR